jgi:hypothetical protein
MDVMLLVLWNGGIITLDFRHESVEIITRREKSIDKFSASLNSSVNDWIVAFTLHIEG